MEKYNLKVGSLKYHLNFFWINFIINFRSSVEYKGNLYSSIFVTIPFTLTLIFFGYVLGDIILKYSFWELKHFILFIFLSDLFVDLVGIFYYGRGLDDIIKSGDVNSYLTKPSSVFLSVYSIQRFNPCLVVLITIFTYLPVLIFIFNYSVYTIFLSILLTILLIPFSVLFLYFLVSFTWIALEFHNIARKFDWEIQYGLLGRYPVFFFINSNSILIFLSCFPIYYISMWIIPLVSLEIFDPKISEIIILMLLPIISIIIIFINWKYGLKNYEAYG